MSSVLRRVRRQVARSGLSQAAADIRLHAKRLERRYLRLAGKAGKTHAEAVREALW